jgi:hypothetical protein
MNDTVVYCPGETHKLPVNKLVWLDDEPQNKPQCRTDEVRGLKQNKPRPISHVPGKTKFVDRIPNPKILFIAAAGATGKFKVRCSDHQRCQKDDFNRGWFEIELNGLGGYTVKPIPKAIWELSPTPFVLRD